MLIAGLVVTIATYLVMDYIDFKEEQDKKET